MYFLCSIYVLLCVKCIFSWCEIFLIQLKVKYFCQSKNNLRPFLDSNLKKNKRKKRKIILSLSENYDILMKKVCKKISFIAYFSSRPLCNRHQRVVLNGQSLKWPLVKAVVSHGSILGSLYSSLLTSVICR